jgi:urease accessory protein
MSWAARLDLEVRRDGERCIARATHEGPLRVLKSLYPEGDGICHQVVVHPPGGIVGGDELAIEVDVGPGAHTLITTPGATRFYRSAGAHAHQSVRIELQRGARLEWLPMATIAYDGCLAENRVHFTLDNDAAIFGADIVALGLPASGEPFARGHFTQHLQWDGHWLERGVIAAGDQRLRDSPLGLAGRPVMATLWFASGSGLASARREALLDAAREGASALEGSSSPSDGLVVWRALGESIEPLWARLVRLRARWRAISWGLPDVMPRVWST